MPDALAVALSFIGAGLQAAVGIGFSIVLGPLLIVTMGAKSAVPVLLALNLVVSSIAVFAARGLRWALVWPSLAGALVGLVVGALTFAHLPEDVVVLAIAVMLLGGALPVRPGARRRAGRPTILAVGALSGLATIWTATPGPVMALGSVLSGQDGAAVRRLVQPVAFFSYGAAFVLLGRTGWDTALAVNSAWLLVGATILGTLSGLALGPRLPSGVIVPAIRILGLVAGLILLARALV
ncbi:MAG: sulfite exporter TauE/SafE family protein [Alphaproteobacteria bacterium]